MPVFLDETAAEDWMNPRERNRISEALAIADISRSAAGLRGSPASVNSVTNDGPELLQTVEERFVLRPYDYQALRLTNCANGA
jgi:putative SOS response-associated peptidase YedK